MPLAGVPLLGHALRGVLASPDVREVVLVVPAGQRSQAEAIAAEVDAGRSPDATAPSPPASTASTASTASAASVAEAATVTVVDGGAERGDSVAAGLRALGDRVDVVLVHDAARCLTPPEVFDRVVAAVRAGHPAVVPGTPVVDTVKQVDADGFVVATPDRSGLRAVQTPQGFDRAVLERAHADAAASGHGATTDDAGLVERLGERVLVVDGHPWALKVTTPADLEAAARILAG